jgi:hypothetical protein
MKQIFEAWSYQLGPWCRLKADHLQWIVQRLQQTKPDAQKRVGDRYENIGFVAGRRDTVARICREHGLETDADRLAGLPETFAEWRDDMQSKAAQ